jgi:flagellin
MSLSVLNNIPSLVAQNNLAVTNTNLQNTLFQLSSGSRINSGADDPAGLSIVNGLQANISALTQSAQNATNGVGQLQVADGALSQVTTLLNRAVTLATEAANGGLTSDQFSAITNEYGSIAAEIDRIGAATNFNGTGVFQGADVANPNQVDSTADSNLTASSLLTAGQTTSVQLGNNATYNYTAGTSASIIAGNLATTAGTNLADGESITIGNGTNTMTFTSGATAFTGGAVSIGASTSAADNITVKSANSSTASTYTYAATDTVANLLTALNANTGTNGISAFINSAGDLEIQGTAADGPLTVSNYGGAGVEGALTETQSTVGDLINQVNSGTLGLTASLNSSGQFNVTSSSGQVTLGAGADVNELGTVTATNTVQDLINGINGSALGVTASLANVQNKNELVGTTQITSADLLPTKTITGTLTIASGLQANGTYAHSYSYTAGTSANGFTDPVTGGNNNTVQGLIDSINGSGQGFHASINSKGMLQIVDTNNSGDITQTTANNLTYTAGGAVTALGAAPTLSQLVIGDPQNRNDLAVTNTDPALGYVAAPNGNSAQGGNADSFVAPEMAGAGSANVFISDGDVTNPLYNTISVNIGALSSSQIGSSSTTLGTQNLGTSTGASAALTVINSAISDVAAMRGTIGAGINRLNSATNVINTQVQNLTSAQSSMQDANIGQVVANMSKYQVLEQTGISALAQANQNEQAVLKLLQ